MSKIYVLVKKDTIKNPDENHNSVSTIDMTPYRTFEEFLDSYKILTKAYYEMFGKPECKNNILYDNIESMVCKDIKNNYSWISTIYSFLDKNRSVHFYYIVLDSEDDNYSKYYEYFDNKMKDIKEYVDTHKNYELNSEYLDLIMNDSSIVFELFNKCFPKEEEKNNV